MTFFFIVVTFLILLFYCLCYIVTEASDDGIVRWLNSIIISSFLVAVLSILCRQSISVASFISILRNGSFFCCFIVRWNEMPKNDLTVRNCCRDLQVEYSWLLFADNLFSKIFNKWFVFEMMSFSNEIYHKIKLLPSPCCSKILI